MTIKEAFNEISKEYDVSWRSNKSLHIHFDELFDSFNYMFIAVIEENGNILLIDYDNHEEEIIALIEKHHLHFNDYHIEKTYYDNADIRAYVEFLQELSETYSNEALQEKEREEILVMSLKEQLEAIKKYAIRGMLSASQLSSRTALTREECETILDNLEKAHLLTLKDKYIYYFIDEDK